MPLINEWNLARSPNYITNVDKLYPYSEVPYLGQYKLVKIPLNTRNIDLVDYWGEGRINSESGISGFRDCYNVNHPSQCVSNGPDRGMKIPNRVAVQSYTTCDTSAYIKDNSVLTVTLMGAPINNSCAKDIARMVDKTKGKVVIYGFNRNSADVRNLEAELKNTGFILCPNYELPSKLKGLTLFDALNNPKKLSGDIRNYVVTGNYDAAVKLGKSLAYSSYGDILSRTVADLLSEGNKNVTSYAYKLWNNDAEYVVSEFFPDVFQLIFNESLVKIINKKDSLALKLCHQLNSSCDRKAYGDVNDQTSKRVSWRLQPEWGNDRVLFRLINIDCGMYLKLVMYQDSVYDREAYGSFDYEDYSHGWYLDPVYTNGELLFFIVNVEYGLGLKLAASTDEDGDRALWGHNSDVHGDPANFGWYIKSWK